MKPFRIHPGSCSCTSCVYRSRSKIPRVQHIIQGGTEIDKLFYGKYLPLRERKLLEKLIRTRDVYDDVRTQLLSSASSDQMSLEHKRNRRDDVSTDKSSVILKVVDLVDRGQMRSENTSKLSSCCSCCSCETLRKIRKRMEKDKHKHLRAYKHIVTCEDIAKYCAEAEERGRKRRNKLSTKISTKISSTLSSKTGAGRLKMKRNLSEPCACTLSLSSMATRSSWAFKKVRSKNKARESAQDRKVVAIDQETKARLPRKPRKKVKNIQSSSTKDIGAEMRRPKTFKIKKDSISLFKEKLLKRTYEENQDVECEPGTCNTDECIPEECLRKIKAKGVGDTRKRKYHNRHSETRRDRSHVPMSSRTKKMKVKDSQVQEGPSPKSSNSTTTILKTKIIPSISKSEIKGKRSVSPKQRHHFETGTEKQDRSYKRIKSATSMTTSISKSKTKAQLTIKEEDVTPKVKPMAKLWVAAKDKRLQDKGIRVQVSPQSNVVTCECKLFTKSTSSLTSLSKQKPSKSRSKRIESHEVDSPPKRHKRAHQKHRRESYQNVEEADLKEPTEFVKVKREKRMKPTHGTAQILLSRSKSRGKSAMSDMDRLRRKSVGSAAFSQKTSHKTSSRSRTKSKHKHSKSAEMFIKKPKYVSKEPSPQTVAKYSPDRQAVKITSSFSFDIEFYKDTYPSLKDDEKKDFISGHHKKIKQKEHRRMNKDHGTGYISSRQNISSQSRSSQSYKNIQGGYRLKRCFCTLKLLTKQKPKFKYSVSKRTMTTFHNKELDTGPRKKRTQTKHSEIVYVVPPATSTQTSLLPYECEPYFCTPGECNPYECAEKIKQRNRGAARHVSKDTNTTSTPKKSKLASTPQSASKSTSRPMNSCDCYTQSSNLECDCKVSGDKSEIRGNRNIKHKGRHSPLSKVERKVSGDKSERHENRNIKHKGRHSPLSKVERKVSGDKSERHENRNIKHKGRHSPSSKVELKVSGDKSEKQSVRIGSNFNFEIEFSKININNQELEDALKYEKLIKRGRKHLQEKGRKVYKPHVLHETSETNKYIKTKKAYTEPFLQRCLCTLKLLKKNKKKAETLSPWRNRNEYVMHMQNNSVTTNRADIRYNPERSKLSSYEWEPNCIPKECDPNNCKKRINLRHLTLHHKYSNILSGDLRSRSTLISKTSTTVTSKSRNTQSFTKECPQNVKKGNDYSEINIMPSCSKQRVMRIGSKSSLKMSYYKSKHKSITTEDLINKHTHSKTQHKHNKNNLNTIGSQQFKRPAHTSMDAEAKRKEKESYIFSAIKRCFSTFKFQKKKNKTRLEDNDVINEKIKTSYPLPNSQISEYKSTLTRLSKLPYNSSSHKYAPNFYIPGMCDPYEYYEEKQRNEIKGLHDHYVSTDRRERKSAMSAITTSDFSGSTMARSAQSRMLKRKKNKGQKVRDKQRDIKGARSFSPLLQAAHKRSIYSFNKEIPKYRFVPIRDTTIENYNTVNEISTVNRLSDKGTKNKVVTLENDLLQANDIRKEAKASNVGFLLKRCFCTLGLQKKNKKKPEFRWHPPVTTQFVQVEQNRHDKKKPGCNVLNKTVYGGEPLTIKLPEGDHLIRENPIGNQSAKHLLKSRSFSRRAHVRSRIEINFDKIRSLLNTQKINPFYRSFYALNVKVSKSKYMSHDNYRALNHYERKLYECPLNDCSPNKCNPVDCLKKIKQLKRSKGDTTSLNTQLSGVKKRKGSDKPFTFGSDFTIKAGVYKDTDPYKSSRRQALRLGSNLGLNFDFFKEPTSRGFFHTGPTTYFDRKEGRRSQTRPTDLQAYGETQNHPKYKSTTRLSPIREKRKRDLNSKSFQYKDYSQQQSKKSKDRNNVRFCTNVNCVEFYNDRKQNKLNQRQRRGEGDVEKQKGPIGKCVCEKENNKKKFKCLCAQAEKKKKLKCFCEKEDKKKALKCFCETEDNKNKLNKFIGKCYCTLKYLKGQNNGKQLTPKASMEMIGKGKKKRKQLDKAKKEMETIMPYSKKKFKKPDSQTKLAQCTNGNTQPIIPDSKKKNKKPVQSINQKKKTLNLDDPSICAPDKNQNQKSNGNDSPLIDSSPYEGTHLKALPCSICPCKGQVLLKKVCLEKRRKGPARKRKQQMPARAVVDHTPLFEMTVNKANMKIINKNEVLQNLGSSGKESKAMKKARAACADILFRNNVATYNSNVPWCERSPHVACLWHVKYDRKVKRYTEAIQKGTMEAPVMEVVIDSENANIINSDQVMKQINNPIKEEKVKIIKAKKRIKAPEQARRKATAPKPAGKKIKGPKQIGRKAAMQTMKSVKKQLKAAAKSHHGKCKCCICRGWKKGKQPPGAQFSMQPRKLKPCICGSVRCKNDWYKLKREERNLKIKQNLQIKKCICGSYLCEEESQKRPEVLLEAAKHEDRKKYLARLAKKKEKLYQIERKKRAKKYQITFNKQLKLRKIEDKRKMRSIAKQKNLGDISMIAESLIDLGTFGSKAFCDIAGSLFQAIKYPRDAVNDVRDAIKKPGGAAKSIHKTVAGMGLYSTLERMKARFLRMPTAKVAVATMEAFPATNYLIHMADKDPKKRMKKFKPKRVKEQTEFKCSLYMASMRKRPCLRVYRMCPWFYPHCMSLLNVWKQLTDISLFILAVAVWSPCILCMELLRGCLCCCMCQG